MAEIVLLTEEEIAERLRCSVARVAQLRAAGALPYLAGPTILVPEECLRSYIYSNLIKNTSKPKVFTKTQLSCVDISPTDSQIRYKVNSLIDEINRRYAISVDRRKIVLQLLCLIKKYPEIFDQTCSKFLDKFLFNEKRTMLVLKKEPPRKKKGKRNNRSNMSKNAVETREKYFLERREALAERHKIASEQRERTRAALAASDHRTPSRAFAAKQRKVRVEERAAARKSDTSDSANKSASALTQPDDTPAG